MCMAENSPEPHADFPSFVKMKVIPNWPRWREGQAIRLYPMLPLNLDARYTLMQYLLAPTWEEACNVLEGSPIHHTGWPVHVLKGLVDGGRLSKTDSEIFGQHIALLELAREIGLTATRKLLTLH